MVRGSLMRLRVSLLQPIVPVTQAFVFLHPIGSWDATRIGALTMGAWRELGLAIATRDGLQLIVVKLDTFFFGDHQDFFLAFVWFALSCLRNVGIRLASPYCPVEDWQKAPLKISSPLIRIIGRFNHNRHGICC